MAENNPTICAQTFTLKTFITASLSGGIAGTSIDLVLFPIDSIKTRLQASSTQKNFIQSAADISKYKGLASAMAASFPCAATFWLSYEYSKYAIRQLLPTQNIHVQHLIASSIAEVCQAIVRCPFEVVKQNMQIGAFSTTSQAVKHIYTEKGFQKGFYAGFTSFVLRDIPFSAIQFPLYELLKMTSLRLVASSRQQSVEHVELPGWVYSVNGAMAGCTSGFLTTPLDVIKTKMMTFQNQAGVVQQCREIVKAEGVKGMFKGASVRCMYLTIGGSAFFGIYEKSKRVINTLID